MPNDPITPAPTRRAVIDPLRKCSLSCKFCYYAHGEMESVRPWDEVRPEIDAAKRRGDIALEITGGEPLEYPWLLDLLKYANDFGLTVRIISSLFASSEKVRRIAQSGKHWWLVSMHGIEEDHDKLVGVTGARKIQLRNLEVLRECGNGFDTNTVIVRANGDAMLTHCEELVSLKPRIVNLINWNPHHAWRTDPLAREHVANLRDVRANLDYGLDALKQAGIGVNLRYFPACCIDREHWPSICNDGLVTLDSGEWSSYCGDAPKTVEEYRRVGEHLSACTEEKGEPCCRCLLQNICGGANKYWHAQATQLYGEILTPVLDNETCRELYGPVSAGDWWQFRRWNERGMANYTNDPNPPLT